MTTPKCRCYINAKYTSKMWQTGHLLKPCPIHESDKSKLMKTPRIDIPKNAETVARLRRIKKQNIDQKHGLRAAVVDMVLYSYHAGFSRGLNFDRIRAKKEGK